MYAPEFDYYKAGSVAEAIQLLGSHEDAKLIAGGHSILPLLKLRFAAPIIYRAAWSLDEGHPSRALHIYMAKIYASEAAVFACRKSLQVHGALGYSFEMDLHLWMKRIWALAAAWGDPAYHREKAAAAVLGGEDA